MKLHEGCHRDWTLRAIMYRGTALREPAAFRSLPLQQHIHTQQAGMREREELRRALEQSDRLLSKVRELEEQNTQLHEDKNEVATKYRAHNVLNFSLDLTRYTDHNPCGTPLDPPESWESHLFLVGGDYREERRLERFSLR
ncbi:hypothetical protein EYF80_039189 [Liparis tanakae]|uniref:Uncharacterized protein n=1 Tax=Liparis tanakae TaxID=230148 RepID=A0A4Z2GBY2_9TELE|nr:hypothetical protein EYF80_039189 [Liparis tanakae]